MVLYLSLYRLKKNNLDQRCYVYKLGGDECKFAEFVKKIHIQLMSIIAFIKYTVLIYFVSVHCLVNKWYLM